MRWTPQERTDWRRWFAWYPVTINGQAVWLEYVYRKAEHDGYLPRWFYKFKNGEDSDA